MRCRRYDIGDETKAMYFATIYHCRCNVAHSLVAVESEPLIPVTTRFLLTTNPTIASTSSSSPAVPKLNVLANERYFDRPEVLKAYREQLTIETPDFVSLGDVPNAGRLRARSQAGITEDVRISLFSSFINLQRPPRAHPKPQTPLMRNGIENTRLLRRDNE